MPVIANNTLLYEEEWRATADLFTLFPDSDHGPTSIGHCLLRGCVHWVAYVALIEARNARTTAPLFRLTA